MSNVISFVGRLSADAEVRHLESGTTVCSMNVANDVGFGDRKVTNWFRVAIFGKRAEGKLPEYLVKGQQVFISGELKVNKYEKDGVEKQSIEVNANNIDLVGKNVTAEQSPSPGGKTPDDGFDDSQIPF